MGVNGLNRLPSWAKNDKYSSKLFRGLLNGKTWKDKLTDDKSDINTVFATRYDMAA